MVKLASLSARHFVPEFLFPIIDLGLDQSSELNLIRRVRTLNVLILVLGVIPIYYIIFYYKLGVFELAIAEVCTSITTLAAFFFIWKRKFYWAIMYTHYTNISWMFFYSTSIGPEAGLSLFYLLASFIPLFVYDTRRERTGLIVGFVLLAIYSYLDFYVEFKPYGDYLIDLPTRKMLFLSYLPTNILIALYSSFLIVKTNQRLFEKLTSLNDRDVMAVSSGHIGMWRYIVENHQFEFSDQAHVISGVTRQELPFLATNWKRLVVVEDRHIFISLMKQLAANSIRDRQHAEFRIKGSDGKVKTIKSSFQVIQHESGNRVHSVLGSILDITREKEREKELVNALEKAKEASLAKSNFLASISHEIRTPLNAIIGITDILQNDLKGSAQEELVENLSLSSVNLLQLLDEVLDFSKIEADKIVVQEERFEPGVFFWAFEKTVQSLVQNEKLMYTQSVHQLPSVLYGDKRKLHQCLLIFVSNALKYTIEGEVRLEVNAVDIGEGKLRLTCRVSDTGIGIKKEELEHIFERFRRAVPIEHASSSMGGTGLGLAIADRLTQLLGWEIDVESEEGKGSVFALHAEFYIPDKTGSKQSVLSRKEDFDNHAVRMLIAEDDETNVFVMKAYCDRLNYQVEFVSSGDQVLKALEEKTFDVVLLDVQMPVLSGIETLKIIRERFLELPVLMCSANILVDVIEEAKKLGSDDYITKPVQFNDFRKIIEKHVHTN